MVVTFSIKNASGVYLKLGLRDPGGVYLKPAFIIEAKFSSLLG